MIASGVPVVVILFGGVLDSNRSFGAEVDRGTLPPLLLAPVDRWRSILAKVAGQSWFYAGDDAGDPGRMFFIFDVNMFHLLNVLGVALGSSATWAWAPSLLR